jgi:hypothetical protein
MKRWILKTLTWQYGRPQTDGDSGEKQAMDDVVVPPYNEKGKGSPRLRLARRILGTQVPYSEKGSVEGATSSPATATNTKRMVAAHVGGNVIRHAAPPANAGSIWQRTSLSRAQFASLYRGPLERFAELVQQFPAPEYHHHSCPGGMLDHGLEIVVYALRLRQSRLLPIGAPPENQAAQSEAWTAAVAYGALLHDLGKIAVDLDVEWSPIL